MQVVQVQDAAPIPPVTAPARALPVPPRRVPHMWHLRAVAALRQVQAPHAHWSGPVTGNGVSHMQHREAEEELENVQALQFFDADDIASDAIDVVYPVL